MSYHLSADKANPPARVDWLGVVPDEWDVLKFKHLLRERKADRSTDLPAGAISFGEVVEKDMLNEDTLATYQSVLPGEYLINPINLNYDLKSLRVALSNIGVRVSPAYIVLTDLGNANQRYLRWLLYYFDVAHMKTLGAGVRQTITFADIGNCAVALPPRETQEPLASYLDRETARIDALIEKKARFIELLKEKRQALITQAVTKGLDPNVPMRDSGVEWIGEVPEGWEIMGLTKCIGPVVDYRGKTPTKVDEGQFLVTAKNVRNGRLDYEISKEYVDPEAARQLLGRGQPEIGDLLFTMEAPLGEVALIDRTDIALAQRIVKFRGLPTRLRTEFLLYWIMGRYCQSVLETLATGSTALGIKASKLGMVPVFVPPIDQQAAIVEFIERECSTIDRLVAHVDKSIQLLSERRSALITAAVTGQIDLREAA